MHNSLKNMLKNVITYKITQLCSYENQNKTKLCNLIGNHIFEHIFKTHMHQYLGTVYPKPKTFLNESTIKMQNRHGFQTYSENIISIYSSLLDTYVAKMQL